MYTYIIRVRTSAGGTVWHGQRADAIHTHTHTHTHTCVCVCTLAPVLHIHAPYTYTRVYAYTYIPLTHNICIPNLSECRQYPVEQSKIDNGQMLTYTHVCILWPLCFTYTRNTRIHVYYIYTCTHVCVILLPLYYTYSHTCITHMLHIHTLTPLLHIYYTYPISHIPLHL